MPWCRLLARDHAAPESTLALSKANQPCCGRVRPLAWCSRPRSSTALLEGALMHELSLAEAIAAIAEGHAGGRRVAKVVVKIGHLRQVVPSALTFAFELVTQGTCVEGAELEIEDVPARIACRS